MIDSFVVPATHQGTRNPSLPIKVPLRFLLPLSPLNCTFFDARNSVIGSLTSTMIHACFVACLFGGEIGLASALPRYMMGYA